MDKSADYINMSEKAVEIQKAWNPEEGDFHTGYDWKEVFIARYDLEDEQVELLGNLPHIWLPRQDQLQDMVINKSGNTPYANMVNLHASFDYMVRYKMLDQCPAKMYANMFESMEQLWVAYVMQELYQKTWNGTDWEKFQNFNGGTLC